MARLRLITDHHYRSHAGRELAPAFDGHALHMHAQGWSDLPSDWDAVTDLLVLHHIAGTAETAAEAPVDTINALRRYVDAGKPVLLLHGGSAAGWMWDWWRPLVGLRWVRPNDPESAVASIHPLLPARVVPASCRHPLAARLPSFDLPADEIYTRLEQTCPVWVLMESRSSHGVHPACHLHRRRDGGLVAGFLPGHRPEVTRHPSVRTCVRMLAEHLLSGEDPHV
jgi:hypothetical protein